MLNASLLTLLLFAAYFAPGIIALCRSHRNGAAILVLNFLGGWTAIGWVIALVWAFTDNTRP